MSDQDPRNPLLDAELEADVQAGAAFLRSGTEPQVVLSALALTALKNAGVERDVQRACESLKKHPPLLVLRALVMTVADHKGPMTAGDVLSPGGASRAVVDVQHRNAAPRNLSPHSGGVAPAHAPDPATFGDQNF